MRREDIAWDSLSNIQKAQMIHFYPELAEDKHRARQDLEKSVPKAADQKLRHWRGR